MVYTRMYNIEPQQGYLNPYPRTTRTARTLRTKYEVRGIKQKQGTKPGKR